MKLRVCSFTEKGVEVFGYSDDDQVRYFLSLTVDEADALGNELIQVRAAWNRLQEGKENADT